MKEIVADVAEDETGKEGIGDACRKKEGQGGKPRHPEKGKKERRHDKSIAIHWKEVVKSMQNEMKDEGSLVIWHQSIHVEEEAVKEVLAQTPGKETEEPEGTKNAFV